MPHRNIGRAELPIIQQRIKRNSCYSDFGLGLVSTINAVLRRAPDPAFSTIGGDIPFPFNGRPGCVL